MYEHLCDLSSVCDVWLLYSGMEGGGGGKIEPIAISVLKPTETSSISLQQRYSNALLRFASSHCPQVHLEEDIDTPQTRADIRKFTTPMSSERPLIE